MEKDIKIHACTQFIYCIKVNNSNKNKVCVIFFPHFFVSMFFNLHYRDFLKIKKIFSHKKIEFVQHFLLLLLVFVFLQSMTFVVCNCKA